MRKIIVATLAATLILPAAAMAQPGPGGPGGGYHDGGRDHHDGDRRDGDRHDGPRGGYDGPRGGFGDGGWQRGPNGRWRGADGRDWRQFRRGERFDMHRAPNYVVINDWRGYRGLRRPPVGYRWVRSGDDALLIGITSGIVAGVIAGAIAH